MSLAPEVDVERAAEAESVPPAPWWRPWVTRAVFAAVGIGALYLIAPEAVKASVSSVETFARVLAVGVVLGLVSWGIGRLIPDRRVATVVKLVPIVAVSWWALVPYLGDDVVDEAFPVVVATADTAPTPDAAPDAAPDENAVPSNEDAAEPPAPIAVAAEPVLLGSGDFHGLTGHKGDGQALIYVLPDGSRVLRLENFDVSNGPGLEVHLVPVEEASGPTSGSKLADLKGNKGNQNYDVPADLDLGSGEWTVLVWCAPFTVEVAHAALTFG